MNSTLILISLVILLTSAGAAALRNLIHSALLLAVSWSGIAAFYLWAGAEFVAFAQALVYVGAISMVVLFAVLLTGRTRTEPEPAKPAFRRIAAALLAGGAIFVVLVAAVLHTPLAAASVRPPPAAAVRALGVQLAGPAVAALLVVGALLTVALFGAIALAATDEPGDGREP